MARSRTNVEELTAAVEEVVVALHRATETEEEQANPLADAVQRIIAICPDIERLLFVIMALLGRYYGERCAFRAALDEKKELLEHLFAAPRRVAEVLGLVREPPEDEAEEEETAWAIVDTPPGRQAVRFAPGVAPEEVCEQDDLDAPVWCWLLEAAPGALVVAGRIDPPPLLRQAGLEHEMIFHGVAHEFHEGGDDEC